MTNLTQGWITVIGDLLEDVVAWIDEPPIAGTDNPATITRTRGGSGANVAAAVALAGGRARFIGRVGDDPAGYMLTDQLDQVGVQVRVQRSGTTGSVVVLVDPSAERTMFPNRSAASELEAIDPRWLVGTSLVHIPAYGLLTAGAEAAIVNAAAAVRAADGIVTVDLSATSVVTQLGTQRLRELLDVLAPRLVFANHDEANAIHLADGDGVPWTSVIKNGRGPARIVRPDGSVTEVEAEPVDVVRDTTGAGDAFAGATLASLQRGETLEQACLAGHRGAALVLGTAGAGGDPAVRMP
jgi:sugar/nucleoside kinase (ribokinase family)